MSILVAVTENSEGQAALEEAANVAARQGVGLVAVNLTSSELNTSRLTGVNVETVKPRISQLDEVEEVLQVIEDRPEVSVVVVGVRRRSPLGKAVLGSIAQRIILESPLPVLSVKSRQS